MEKMNKTKHIFLLEDEARKEIELKLKKELIEMDFTGNELNEILEEGLSGRLSDLEDTIDIYSLDTVSI